MHGEGQRLQEQLLCRVIIIGLFTTLIGSFINIVIGFPFYSIIHHIMGAAVLITSGILIRRNRERETINSIAVMVIGYYCFIFTPVNWFLLEGLKGNTLIIAFAFVILVVFLLKNPLRNHILLAYILLLVILTIGDLYRIRLDIHKASYIEVLNFASVYVILAIIIWIVQSLINRFDWQRERLFELATRDHMTKAFNLRYMENEIQRLFGKGHSNGSFANVFSVAITDLDNFKQINDTYGHNKGNEVIISFYKVLRRTVDKYGMVGRLGGDEFIVVFPELDRETAASILSGFNQCLSQEDDLRNLVSLTISVGVADSIEGQDLESIFNIADQRLYKAKDTGKDTIIYN